MEATLSAIAQLYDRKTRSANLNLELARRGGLFFNHNGMLLPSETLDLYRRRIADEDARLLALHAMERNVVRFGMLYLGSPFPGMLGLDAGCGAGGAGLMIHDLFGCDLEGFTLSPEQAAYAHEAARLRGVSSHVRFDVGNMLELECDDVRYDFIWACESSEHAPDLEAMFREFARVSRGGARLVVIAWNTEDPEVARRIDEHYLTTLHALGAYEEAAATAGWNPLATIDLTERTVSYWELRAESPCRTGSEAFMMPAYRDGKLGYHLMVFERAG